MPQKTNLNINPYYDDFDKDNNFYRVLFKPGYPIQARELTTLQSILQGQIESFGSHIFKEGSMVIPGGVTYDRFFEAVKINPTHFGLDLNIYLNDFVGKRISGATSGVTATIQKVVFPPTDGIEYPTIYVKYLNSDNSFQFNPFSDGETLIAEDAVTYGNTTISAGDSFASVLDVDATATAAAVHVSSGIYFIRGTFVSVQTDTIVLDSYKNDSSYRVGLVVNEELISAGDDSNLYDNARGFSNYAAPGADRLKITAKLGKKVLTDFDDKNFVELVRIDRGEIKKLQDKTTYSIIKDYFAKRTFDESGDYTVNQFTIDLEESLNDQISNNGIYTSDQKTEQLNDPSDDLVCARVSSGTAYVRGYDVDFAGTTILDLDKPRDTTTLTGASVPFKMGNLLKVNNVQGSPFVGINNNNNVVTLQSFRKDESLGADGETIGQARVYNFALADSSYSNASSTFDLYLFDVQTYTKIVLGNIVTSAYCPASSYIKGLSSGATGYVVTSPGSGSTGIQLTQTSGQFIVGEQISINGSTEYVRTIVDVEAKNVKDIKSVYQTSATVGGITTDFSADTVLRNINPRNFKETDKITISPTGIASCAGRTFSGISTNSIIRYQRDKFTTETFARVVSVSNDLQFLTLTGVSTVTGVCDGGVVGIDTVTTTFTVGEPSIENQKDGFLYSKLSSENVASVDLSDSTLTIVHQETGKSTSNIGALSLNTGNIGFTSAFFEPYEGKSYSIAYDDGTYEPLSSSQITFGANGTTINFAGLEFSKSDVTVNTTIKRQGIKSKQKNYDRSHQVIIDKSISGVSTAISGLTTSFYYGLRVEDRELSLNTPDVVKVHRVLESLGKETPVLDKLTFVSGLGLDVNAIIGEKVIGKVSNAVGQIVSADSATDISYVSLNANKFQLGESVTFEDSGIESSVQRTTVGSYLDITDRFTLDGGQREQYYDYSRLVRNNQTVSPSRKLLVICDRYVVPANDNGDFYTVNSYDKERYSTDIPRLADGTRISDILDFRPRVSDFSTAAPNKSPFDFASRTFGSTSVNTTLVSAPNESSILGVEYYLGRIDKIIIDIDGNISVVKGTSARNPKEPSTVNDSMTLAVIKFPPYLFHPDDAEISVIDNKRFTMKDIGVLEDRIDLLESVTSLSLLELSTSTLQVQDAQGLNRFKSGFFVDDFADGGRIDFGNFDTKVAVNAGNKELVPPIDVFSLELEPAFATNINTTSSDLSQDLQLLDSNVQKTGDLITLKYDEKTWLEQPLASRSENVNPFNMVEFVGRIVLTPGSDNWTRTVVVPGGTRNITGNTTLTFLDQVLISSEPDTFMRSRNVQFQAGGLRPVARFYPFMDGISGIDVVPKLLEVSMTSGTFNVGETVEGFVGSEKLITFRTARPDHKDGPYNAPTTTYNANPYNTSESFSTQYSASGTTLNVDTRSLSANAQGTYFGYVTTGMSLVGATSGATATITDVRLVADTFGDLIGTFFIRDPNTSPPPTIRIKTGDRTFRVSTSVSDAEQLPGSLLISHGEGIYSASGIVETFREDTVVQTVRQRRRRRRGGKDPLAQSFTVDETGAFLTSVDLFFSSKDENEKLFVEIREVELGTPTNRLVHDYARQVLYPSDITVSTDASVATNVKFPSPIYLQQNREYAIVLLAPTTNNYEVWIAQMGERTVNGQNLPDAEAVMVTRQYIGGSLFKSQNGTIWTPSQFEDMKFKLYKANFVPESGTAFFYNPSLESVNENVPRLQPDAVKIYPRKIDVGITSSTLPAVVDQLVPGARVKGSASLANGYIENVGGGVSFTGITTSNVGLGYSSGTYGNVTLYPIVGRGRNLVAQTVTFTSEGTLDGIILNTLGLQTGNGWVAGDVIGITTSDVGGKGSGARMTIRDTMDVDTLFLTNVQGDNFTVGGNLQIYVNETPGVSLASTQITSSDAVGGLYSGNVVELNHYNHGMSADNNLVDITGIAPDTTPTTLSVDLNITDTQISLADTTSYSTFEGITTASGYLKVNNEIIYYDSIGAGQLGIATRGVDGTAVQKHLVNDPVYKYEVGDVSLTRINTEHNMSSSLTNYRDIDKYHVEFNRGGRSSGERTLNFREESTVGGKNIRASRNIQFNTIQPQFDIITPGRSSSVTGTVRTVSGTSAGGAEPSFIDQGFEAVQINDANELSTTRIVCSQVNETTRLTALPKNRSLTVGVSMSRDPDDSNLSPAIDTQTAFAIFGRNRLNKPITDYVNDSRSNQLSGDPHAFTYISNQVNLEQPATSLKVFVAAYRDASADFRVLYRLFKADSSEVAQTYLLFPGYDNLNDTNNDGFGDTVINVSQNSGRADAIIAPSNLDEFNEYQFSIDNVDQFTGYQIKIVANGSDESRAPRFKDLRAIALA